MRRMLALLLPMVLATFLLSCGPYTPRSMISWVDFIQFDDIFYLGTGDSYNLTLSDLGPQHGEVLFRVEGNIHNEKYHNKDGDAAFHDPGTLVYTLKGYKPEFRLAILEENRVRIYEANRNPKAVKGADLFDLENKVEYITVNSKDGSTVLGTIDNPQIVDDLVAMTLAAGLSQIAPPDGSELYNICYHLLDGTKVNRSYWIETGQMWPGVALPQEFADLVRNALND